MRPGFKTPPRHVDSTAGKSSRYLTQFVGFSFKPLVWCSFCSSCCLLTSRKGEFYAGSTDKRLGRGHDDLADRRPHDVRWGAAKSFGFYRYPSYRLVCRLADRGRSGRDSEEHKI